MRCGNKTKTPCRCSTLVLLAGQGRFATLIRCVGVACTRIWRATQIYGSITIIGVRTWDLENIRRVQLKFEYPPPEHRAFRTGYIVCAYDFDFAARADLDRVPMAKAVYYKGRYLSENELDYLNRSLFRPHPEFKITP